MNSKNNPSFTEIKASLNKVYDRIRIQSTQEKGYELFKKIISKNISNKTLLFSVINNIQEKLSKLFPKEKPPYLNLLSLFFFNQSTPESLKLYYQYLSPILSILQSLIIDKNIEILTEISQVFAEIVQYLMPNDISASNKELDQEEKESYESLQSFCILNIKIDQNINRVLGSLCLTKLVENCPFVLKYNYMKYILDNIIENISKDNFNAKSELLNCLISLILGAESLFCPYANMTLYKILDFLTDKDWQKRKLALNVIYTMIFYCKDEILPLKEHIINFLNVLKNDNIKEVREVSILILQIFDDNNNKSIKNKNSGGVNSSKSGDNIKENKKNKNNKTNNYQRVKVVKRLKNNSINNINNKNNKNKIISTSPNNFSNRNKKTNYETNFNKRHSNNSNNINKISSNRKIKKENSNIVIDKNEKRLSVNIRNNSFGKRKKNKTYKNNSKEKYDYEENGKKRDFRGRSPLGRSVSLSKENRNSMELKYPKYINRKKDYSFVNQKMVIKPDPNKSIFNSDKNMAFFQQSKNQNEDVIIIPKEDKIDKNNYNTFNNFYKSNKFGINKDENEELEKDKDKDIENNKTKNIENNNNNINIREKIDKDYDDSISSINKLITLDAKIKADNNKHIDNIMKDDNNNKNEDNENKINLDKDKINENNNNINNNENLNNSTNANNTNLINILLTEVRALSNKQISLLDLMDEIQTNTQQQIEDLNQKIVDLDTTVKDLNHQLYILQKDQ